MRIDRSWAQHIAPRVTDVQIAEAITARRRFTAESLSTPVGTLFRVVGYARSGAGLRPVTVEDVEGIRLLTLLTVVFVDEGDRGEVARVLWVLEADEEDFASYG